jgi:hypothetical protein
MNIKNVGTKLNENNYLWGYFDFHKFLSLVIEESILFSRMDKMEDVNEGISLNQLLLMYGADVERMKAKNNKENSKRTEMPLETRQKKYFISCWLIHHRESVAMWNAYSDENGIALKFKASDLITAISENTINTNQNEKIKTLYHGKITYKDFFNPVDRRNLKDEVKIIGFHKDISFEHELEYRFLIKQDTHNFKEDDIPFVKMKIQKFKKLKFDLIFHPKMEPWKKENIKSVIKALGSKSITIKDSELKLKQW